MLRRRYTPFKRLDSVSVVSGACFLTGGVFECVWSVRMYGVGEKFLTAVQSFYVECRECVRLGNEINEWIPVNVGSRQRRVMSPWLLVV